MINKQEPEKPVFDALLDVHSIFPTIQGEGPHTGRPAVFIRLAGCNLQCPGCDTDYTSGRKRFERDAVVRKALDLLPPRGIIVVTGGEPFRQPITSLLIDFVERGLIVQVETNGTLPMPVYTGADIVCSPKAGGVHHTIKAAALAYKYVINWDDVSEDDGLPLHALGHPASPMLARPPSQLTHSRIYVQPADVGDAMYNRRNLEAAIDSCMRFGYTLGTQLHKTIGVQ